MILKMESGSATLDNILEAGKVFTCAELVYVQRKIVEGFAILQENGIANRDVKPQNIVLVEDPLNEARFFYKITDFGIGCQLEKNVFSIPSSSIMGITKTYAAPEVLRVLEENFNTEDEYNPFFADVYSLGLLTLKMINRKWGKKQLKIGWLSMKEKLEGYEPILELIKGVRGKSQKSMEL